MLFVVAIYFGTDLIRRRFSVQASSVGLSADDGDISVSSPVHQLLRGQNEAGRFSSIDAFRG